MITHGKIKRHDLVVVVVVAVVVSVLVLRMVTRSYMGFRVYCHYCTWGLEFRV